MTGASLVFAFSPRVSIRLYRPFCVARKVGLRQAVTLRAQDGRRRLRPPSDETFDAFLLAPGLGPPGRQVPGRPGRRPRLAGEDHLTGGAAGPALGINIPFAEPVAVGPVFRRVEVGLPAQTVRRLGPVAVRVPGRLPGQVLGDRPILAVAVVARVSPARTAAHNGNISLHAVVAGPAPGRQTTEADRHDPRRPDEVLGPVAP